MNSRRVALRAAGAAVAGAVLLSVPALSWAAAPVTATPTAGSTPTASPFTPAAPVPAAAPAPVPQAAAPAPAPAPAPEVPKANGERVVIDDYTVALGSQEAIDRCELVLYWDQPLWFAAHDYCGYSWMSDVAVGTTLTVTDGPAAGVYRVVENVEISRQSGDLPDFDADLVLQTCVGDGTGFSLAVRIR